MAGDYDFLHIKKHTAGSSNELSLDVLDHKRAEADARESRSGRVFTTATMQKGPKAPKASQGSYKGVSGAAPLSSQPEVARRKEARHLRRVHGRILAGIAVVAAVVAVVAVGVLYGSDKVDNSVHIERLVDRLSAVDESLVKADSLMEAPFDADGAGGREAIVSSSPGLSSELNRITVDAQTLGSGHLDDSESVVVTQISDAAQARSQMLDAAVRAFKYVSSADSRVAEANTMWNSVLNADQLAREAISEANRATTPEATTSSLDKTRAAHEGFSSALSELRAIMKECGVDLTAQEAYLQKKTEALDLAVATSEALLAGNREEARVKNEAYNEADSAAAELAEGLPPSIGGLVLEQYQENVVKYQEDYDEARAQVIQADAVIRGYLAN